jgi:hypothetical protein
MINRIDTLDWIEPLNRFAGSNKFDLKVLYLTALLFLLLANHSFLHAKEMRLPQPVANNAVALQTINDQPIGFSFNGLASGKTFRDVHAKAYSINLVNGETRELAGLPDGKGRLASIAVSIKNKIYVIGGYTVAADHSEVSTPEIYQYDPLQNSYSLLTKMPIPVDDTVALVYQDRYLYLISGWHDTGNIADVQVFDVQTGKWFAATPFPGASVFGHAGGLVGNQFVIADGVKVLKVTDGKRTYGPSEENWHGLIDPKDPSKIAWTKIAKHPFKPLYRMAATGVDELQKIVFAAGSDNPYNYNGIGYDKVPSSASNQLFSYDLVKKAWSVHPPLTDASMDHRGLLLTEERMFIIGGMGDNQQVTANVQAIPLSNLLKNKEK